MKFIDLHCDCINRLYYSDSNQDILKNSFHVDIEKLKKGECFIQTFAIFLDEGFINSSNLILSDEFESMIKNYYTQINLAKDSISHISDKINNNDTMYALLSAEGCGFIEDNAERFNKLVDFGVKMASLTWNYENCLAFPNSADNNVMEKGLKKLGFEAIEFFNEKKIIADISHLSDGGAIDVLKTSKMPVIASHSNARALVNNARNLSDELIRKIADSGGVIGINFYPLFLSGSNEASIDDIIRHTDYIINIGGEDVVSIGSDFDGIECTPQIDDISQIQKLYSEFINSNHTFKTAEKLFYKNAERLFKTFNII
ncbi:MAG: membrane dipeptidase [Eubacteriaceae bacterium]|nr:membrane dipeptidase [Eubacteriaceae bacterium]